MANKKRKAPPATPKGMKHDVVKEKQLDPNKPMAKAKKI